MDHQVDKLDKVQHKKSVSVDMVPRCTWTDYLVACTAILGHLFWGLEQDAMNNMFERDCSQITRGTRTRKGSKSQTDRQMVRLVADGRTVHGHMSVLNTGGSCETLRQAHARRRAVRVVGADGRTRRRRSACMCLSRL
jgi:hypothetical protein